MEEYEAREFIEEMIVDRDSRAFSDLRITPHDHKWHIQVTLSEQDRLLPGGYVYLSDLLGRPDVLRKVGRVIARQYIDKQIDGLDQLLAMKCSHRPCVFHQMNLQQKQ